MKRNLLLFIMLFLAIFDAYSQRIFVTRSDGILEDVTINGSIITSKTVATCDGRAYSIATSGNKFYAMGDAGLFSADYVGGSTPQISNCKLINANLGANNLAVDDKGVIYYAISNQLFAIFPGTATPVFEGQMPYSAAGDLIFYNNNLYMGAVEGIVKIPLNDPSKTTLYISYENSGIYCLASAVVNGKNTVYTIEADIKDPAIIRELDMDGKRVKRTVGTLPYYVNDGASEIPDADIPIIEVPKQTITPECDVFNKAKVEIIPKPHTGKYTYLLSTGETNDNGIFDNVPPGSYTVTIISSENALRKTVKVTVKDFIANNPVISVIQKNPKCNEKGEIKLDAGTANSLYKIKFNNDIFDFDHIFAGLEAGQYHFTIVNAQGCVIDEKEYALTQDDCAIIISATNITQECDAFNKGHVEIVCGLHNSTYTFTLNTGQANKTGFFDNLSLGDYSVNITSDGVETPVAKDFTINDFTAGNPLITVIKKNPLCNSKGQLKLDAGGGNPSYKIKFGGNVFGFDHTFTGLDAGNYHFTILNSQGCIIDEKDYELTQDECPPVGVINETITRECDVFNKGRVEIVCKPHTNQYTFALDNGQNNTTGVFENLPPGKYQATITSNGDESPVNVNFTIPDYTLTNPTISFIPKNPVCNLTGEIKLDAGIDNSSYHIKFNNNIFGFEHVFAGLVAGSYHFTILSNDGCVIDEKEYELKQDECPPIVVNNIEIVQKCDSYNRATINITTASHPDDYIYTLAGISNTTGIFDDMVPGTYNLVITSSGGDKLEQAMTVREYKLSPDAISYKIRNAVCELPGEIKFTLNDKTTGAAQIKLDEGLFSIDKTITGLSPGDHLFIILNGQGCILDEFNINIPEDDCVDPVFPNTFTPNNDGINDIFRPSQNGAPLNYKLQVFTRQGSLVFQSLNYTIGWDGTYNGKQAPFGVYYWLAGYATPSGKVVTKSGYVTLIR